MRTALTADGVSVVCELQGGPSSSTDLRWLSPRPLGRVGPSPALASTAPPLVPGPHLQPRPLGSSLGAFPHTVVSTWADLPSF